MSPQEERKRKHEDNTTPAEKLKIYAKSHPDDIAALVKEWLLSDNTGCSLRS